MRVRLRVRARAHARALACVCVRMCVCVGCEGFGPLEQDEGFGPGAQCRDVGGGVMYLYSRFRVEGSGYIGRSGVPLVRMGSHGPYNPNETRHQTGPESLSSTGEPKS